MKNPRTISVDWNAQELSDGLRKEWVVKKSDGLQEIGGFFFLIRIWKVLKLMERTVERFFKRADDNLLVLIPK